MGKSCIMKKGCLLFISVSRYHHHGVLDIKALMKGNYVFHEKVKENNDIVVSNY